MRPRDRAWRGGAGHNVRKNEETARGRAWARPAACWLRRAPRATQPCVARSLRAAMRPGRCLQRRVWLRRWHAACQSRPPTRGRCSVLARRMQPRRVACGVARSEAVADGATKRPQSRSCAERHRRSGGARRVAAARGRALRLDEQVQAQQHHLQPLVRRGGIVLRGRAAREPRDATRGCCCRPFAASAAGRDAPQPPAAAAIAPAAPARPRRPSPSRRGGAHAPPRSEEGGRTGSKGSVLYGALR